MYARLLKPGLALVVAVMLLSAVFASSAVAAVAPVTNLTATAYWDYQMEVHLAMNVPASDGVVDVFFSPTHYFSVRPDPATLLPDEYWDEGFPGAPGPFQMDTGGSLDHDKLYKISVFFGVYNYVTDTNDWSPAAETTTIAYLPLPTPTPLAGHQIHVDYGYDGIAWGARSVHLGPGDVLDVFLTNPNATMTLYPPGSTVQYGQVAQSRPRTLWSRKGAGFAYRVPDGGLSGDYILCTPDSVADEFTIDWSVTRGTGPFKLAVSSTRTMVRNRQTHAPLYWLRKGTIGPADTAFWSAKVDQLMASVGIIRSGTLGDCTGMRIDVYATYRGKTRWWIGPRHAIRRVTITSNGKFTARVNPTINFPGDWHAIEGWRGRFKYRFYLPPYGDCTAAYSPVYSAKWSGPK
jgi:hypothetical protein